jgi:hypothetical protein
VKSFFLYRFPGRRFCNTQVAEQNKELQGGGRAHLPHLKDCLEAFSCPYLTGWEEGLAPLAAPKAFQLSYI